MNYNYAISFVNKKRVCTNGTGSYSFGVTYSNVPGITLSVKTIPFRWSTSWQIAWANRSLAFNLVKLPNLS